MASIGSSSSNDFSSPASDPAVERMARGAHQAVDRMAGTAGHAVERVRSGVSGAVGTVSEKVQDLAAGRDQWVEGCRERVREHPLATLGIALAAGYMLARLSRE